MASSRPKLFIDYGSQPSRAVLWLIKLLELDVEVQGIRLDKGESKTPQYMRDVHPLGKVPALVHNGRSLIESNAILVYLTQIAPNQQVAQQWFPRNDAAQSARINSYLHYHHEFRGAVAGWFVANIMKKAKTPVASVDPAPPGEKKLQATLDLFESYWIANTNYIQSDNPTIADLQALNELNQILPFHQSLLESRPKLAAWVQRVERIPHYDFVMTGWRKVVPLLKARL